MTKPITEAELVEMFKLEVDRWHCGCNAGGMCGCYIDRDTGMVHRRDGEPAHGQMMRLISEVRRLRTAMCRECICMELHHENCHCENDE